MLSNLNYLLVTTTCLVTMATAIRVDWNTNTGPIIPPTPRTTIRPQPPFREPAPVWEDLSNDIPNPNPYIYVPPPPSRPKQRLNTNVNYNTNANSNNYGTIITPQNAQTYYHQHNTSPQVSSLAPQYIPNVGTRYVAVVPKSTTSKYPLSSANSLSPNDNISYKLQGKYNAKTKKYKAYEKVKYVPLNYYPLYKESDATSEASSLNTKSYVPESMPLWHKGHHQDLPYEKSAVKFNSKWPTTTTTTTTAKSTTTTKRSSTKSSTKSPIKSSTFNSVTSPTKASLSSYKKSYTKHVYIKDSLVKQKEKFSKSVDKAKKS